MRLRNVSAGVAVAAVLALAPLSALAQQPLKTAVDGTFAPHAMPKLEGGIQGFNVDLANEIGKRLKRPVDITATQFSGILPSLQAGTIDFVAAPVTVTKERAENYLFTEGYLNTDYQFLTKKGEPPITDLKQLKGKVIAVNKGAVYDSWARGLEGRDRLDGRELRHPDRCGAGRDGGARLRQRGRKHRCPICGQAAAAAAALLCAFDRPGLGGGASARTPRSCSARSRTRSNA